MNARQASQVSAADFLPRKRSVPSLRAAAAGCRGCDLYKRATQTVFGEGDAKSRLMFVGEQPGDAEDLQGEPFVGPAGRLLDELLDEVGLNRSEIWLTNAVKHFKFEVVRGERRLHKKPTTLEVRACRPWLDAEIELISPEAIVLLGATAAQSLVGPGFRITQQRGRWQTCRGMPRMLPTWHPSAVLRAPESDDRHRLRAELVRDLRLVVSHLGRNERARS